MPSIPLIVVWFSVLCGYLPYSMGFAFLNPIVLIGYGLLGLLTGANIINARTAAASSITTTLLAIAVVNITSGIPHLVLPSTSILLATLALSLTSTLATAGLRAAWLRRNLDEPAIRFRLRLVFAAIALSIYGLNYLPYDAKMTIASHTTNSDLIIFAMVAALIFVGTWRLTR